MEQRARVVEAQQRRLAVRRFDEIADVDDQRADVAGKLLLVAQRGHPGAAALRWPREIIAEEQADLLAVAAAHLPHPHVGMPHRHVPAWRARPGEQALRRIKDRFGQPDQAPVRLYATLA